MKVCPLKEHRGHTEVHAAVKGGGSERCALVPGLVSSGSWRPINHWVGGLIPLSWCDFSRLNSQDSKNFITPKGKLLCFVAAALRKN